VTLAGEADGAEITLDIEEPDPRPEGAPPEAPGGTMRERAELAGGRWRVESRPGVYRLRFWLPNDPTPAPEFAPPGRAGDARGQEP
jgi:hypothetical protein